VGTRLAQVFCGDLAVIAAEESSAVACRQLGWPGNFRHIGTSNGPKPTSSRSALRGGTGLGLPSWWTFRRRDDHRCSSGGATPAKHAWRRRPVAVPSKWLPPNPRQRGT